MSEFHTASQEIIRDTLRLGQTTLVGYGLVTEIQHSPKVVGGYPIRQDRIIDLYVSAPELFAADLANAQKLGIPDDDSIKVTSSLVPAYYPFEIRHLTPEDLEGDQLDVLISDGLSQDILDLGLVNNVAEGVCRVETFELNGQDVSLTDDYCLAIQGLFRAMPNLTNIAPLRSPRSQ